ncbi:MAG: hypothetical protein AAF824_03440 [Bacteroidota bacterium]
MKTDFIKGKIKAYLFALLLIILITKRGSCQDVFHGLYVKDEVLDHIQKYNLTIGYVKSELYYVAGLSGSKGVGIYKSFDGSGIIGLDGSMDLGFYGFFFRLSGKLVTDFNNSNVIFQPSIGFNTLYFKGEYKLFKAIFFSFFFGRNFLLNSEFENQFNTWTPTLLIGLNLNKPK